MNAYKKAAEGKHWQARIKQIDENPEPWLTRLKEMLENGTYHTSPYHTKKIFEPKERTIYILPFFPDRIAQHAVMNVVEPIWSALLIKDSYACIKGRGQHAGSKRCMEMVRRNPYCLKCDISKFYPSIHHETLKRIIRKKIKDERILAVMNEVIDSTHTETNVPIGNYMSQWFGNLYLNELDMAVKHTWHIKDYIRYCDDFCFFGDKGTLRRIREWLPGFLVETLRLKLSKCELFPVSHGVDFLGYRHFPRYILVRKRTAKRIARNLRRVMYQYRRGEITKEQAVSKIASAKGWLRHANAHHFSVSHQIEELWEEVTKL